MTVPFETVILIVTATGILQAVTLMLWHMETRALRNHVALLNLRYDYLRRTSHRRDRRTGRLLRLGE
jgi:hypothetical protein